jgi:DNA-directed RNA polymerase specialized sigma24 family protein
VYLKFYSNLSYQEIAAVMAIQYQSAVNLVHEAIKTLGNNLILPLFAVAVANL